MRAVIKWLFFAGIIFAFTACEEETTYATRFQEFSAHCDTAANADSTLCMLLVDSLVKKLPDYELRSYKEKDLVMVKWFSKITSPASSLSYDLHIKRYNSNRSAFDEFSKAIAYYIKDSAAINRLHNFEDIAGGHLPGDVKYIYLDNMVLFLRCDQNDDVNFYLKKLLIGRPYKEIEFLNHGVFWTNR